jgi:hypothetical protein
MVYTDNFNIGLGISLSEIKLGYPSQKNTVSINPIHLAE